MIAAPGDSSVMIEIELEDGRRVFAEAADPSRDARKLRERLTLKIAEMREAIVSVVQTIEQSVVQAFPAKPPAKVGVEFGLKLSTKTPGGVILGQVGGEASIVVKLEWNPAEEAAA